ncbi:MAG: YedE-related selenium metabolism membrane protein [Desulfomonile tiedjei]|uniref:YedE-related selenium metabolism membrane protein n=1 Tax=Desulfomonile tiedjei TaxID=2358 RepID=A0A9D6V387_9BACT|nr:YedE-related selenium metabolism membrane protein [Desulfomonile tiedjei]
METKKNLFATSLGIVAVGAVIGVLAALLQKWGNPGNMGICVACFERDVAGSLGLHRADVVQYLRPEIFGFVLGAFVAALSFSEFKPRSGSAPLARFLLGMSAMIGALVFLGCPWRAVLRLAGGDGNALFGLAGLATGVGIGTVFFRSGYSLGRTSKQNHGLGLLMPLVIAGLLVLGLIFPQIPNEPKSGVLFYSLKGPGSQHAPLIVSLVIGLAVGFAAQRSRFCTMGALRDLILFRHWHLFSGFMALLVAAWLTNLALGQFHPGFANQPVAHTQSLWNFFGMLVAGLAFALAGGCPGRQLFMSGEGDGDAAVFVFGMIVGAAFAHNFGLASSPAGIGPHGMAAVAVALIACLYIGFSNIKRVGA